MKENGNGEQEGYRKSNGKMINQPKMCQQMMQKETEKCFNKKTKIVR